VGFLIKTKKNKMAICNALTAPLTKSCDLNAGGIKRIYVADFSDFTYTLTSGKITALTPADPNLVLTTVATVNSTTIGFVRVISTVAVPGNVTAQLYSGRWFYFTYNVRNIDGVTVTQTYWSGQVLVSTYDTVNNRTLISPDYAGFTPLVGQSADPAPPNTSNQTVSTYVLFEIQTNKNVCNFQETANIDLANGSTYFSQVVTLELSRRETTKRTYIESLVSGQKELSLVIQDSNSLYWIIGIAEGSYVTGIDGGTGVSKSERNGYQIIFTAMEPEQAYEIDYSAISNFIVNA
jgi:hypothetical protein